MYATGRALAALGVVPGSDSKHLTSIQSGLILVTPECALAKLSYLLSKNRSVGDVRQLMQVSMLLILRKCFSHYQKNLRGELSTIQQSTGSHFSHAQLPLVNYILNELKCASDRERHFVERALLPYFVFASIGSGDLHAFNEIRRGLLEGASKQLLENLILNCTDYGTCVKNISVWKNSLS
jgi:hypothetical protein